MARPLALLHKASLLLNQSAAATAREAGLGASTSGSTAAYGLLSNGRAALGSGRSLRSYAAQSGSTSWRRLAAWAAQQGRGSPTTPLGWRAREAAERLQHQRADLMRQWHEFKSAAIVNSIALSQPGQNLLAAVAPALPPLLLYLLFPWQYRALAYQISSREAFERSLADRRSSDGGKSALTAAAWLSAAWAAMPLAVHRLVEEVLIAARAAFLGLLFAPMVLMAPVVVLLGVGRNGWLDLITWTLQQAGPAFIKWGQWAATRPDLFPEDLCDRLEQLQSSAPEHSGAISLRTVEAAFGRPIAELFSSFDTEPVASGSIAQIHRATLSRAAAELAGCAPGAVVAVKVRHPGVSDIMHRDFVLMQRAAALCSMLPALRELRLEESIRQFGGPLKEQLDLAVEASHLRRFNANFRSWTNVSFPVPLFPLVTNDVLVESFEEGMLITRYVRNKHKHNEVLAQTGVDLFLKMMLADNFIHADLHPGNILVKEAAGMQYPAAWLGGGGSSSSSSSCHASSGSGSTAGTSGGVGAGAAASAVVGEAGAAAAAQAAPAGHGRGWGLALLGRGLGWLPASVLSRLGAGVEFQPKIVLLDTGMIVELSREDKDSLMGFFKSLTKMDGRGLGQAILKMAVGETCKDPAAFKADILAMFEHMDREHLRRESQSVIKDIIERMRQHQVTLRSSVSTVVVTSLVLEGWSSKLDPDVKILETMRSMLASDWSDRIGLAVDKIMASGALAMS